MTNTELEEWVRAQFPQVAYKNGEFIGKSVLKRKLIELRATTGKKGDKGLIRQLINKFVVGGQLQPRSNGIHPPSHHAVETSLATTSTQYSRDASLQPTTSRRSTPTLRSPSHECADSGFETGASDAEEDSHFGASLGASISATNSTQQTPSAGTYDKNSNPSQPIRTPTPEPLSTKSSTSKGVVSKLKKGKIVAPADEAPSVNAKPLSLVELVDLRKGLLSFDTDAKATDEEDSSKHSVKNAVIFSGDILGQKQKDLLPQYGLLGGYSQTASDTVNVSQLFLNTNIPFSAFVCGVQGSGKSHTSTCMLENCLIPEPILGILRKPLSALVFNFSEYTSRSNFRPSEAAFLAIASQGFEHLPTPKVKVLVSPSNFLQLSTVYSEIPGVEVQPFLLHPEDLNIGTMLTLMSVDQSQGAPLYMATVTKILREMAKSKENFDYLDFKKQLKEAKLDRTQVQFLTQRLDLLESFLDLNNSTTKPEFNPGEVTIIDLSCPFVDPETACVLFKIGMGMFLASDAATGKAIFVDEAHKYMTNSAGSKALTDSLMNVIRQQRHFGARVIISTQEPTISPKLIDLCSITVIHRFSSPDWLATLRKHISTPHEDGNNPEEGLFKKILKLKTGEALVFAPSSIATRTNATVEDLLRVRIRKRVTHDGGRSIVSV